MTKLTKAQRALLEKMAAGSEVLRVGGVAPRIFLSTTMKNVPWGTLHALQRRRLVENYYRAEHEFDPTYRITDAGRAMLAVREGK